MSVLDRGMRRAATAVVIGVAGACLVGVGAGAATAATQTATLSVNKACYVTVSVKHRALMTITGSGYAPDISVNISDGSGELDVSHDASATGALLLTVPAPAPFLTKPGEKKDTITATQITTTGTEIIGTASTHLTVLAAEFGTTRKAPGLGAYREDTDWTFSGFPEGKTIWGHYFFGPKLVAKQAFGRAQGPCGLLTVKKRVLPVTPRGRDYNLYVDSRETYSRTAMPRVPVKLRLMSF